MALLQFTRFEELHSWHESSNCHLRRVPPVGCRYLVQRRRRVEIARLASVPRNDLITVAVPGASAGLRLVVLQVAVLNPRHYHLPVLFLRRPLCVQNIGRVAKRVYNRKIAKLQIRCPF
jgi:hypothetical protein